jgi:DNA topoisomerase-2
VANQIAAGVVQLCMKDFTVEEHEVKRHLWVFVNATVENQTFNSPTKEALTTPLRSDCELSDDFLQRGMVKNFDFFSCCIMPI